MHFLASTSTRLSFNGMCGRYRIKDPELFREYVRQVYGIEIPPIAPRFNVSPSQSLPALITDRDGRARASLMRWGFVPFWDKSEKPKLAPINARSETAFAKPMFRQAIQKRRALIPADGFYEWMKAAGSDRKQPFDISLKSGAPFFFAGIYEEESETRPASYLLFTTRPNELMQPIHDRMPAILTEEKAKQWIQPGPIAPEQLDAFMQPFPADAMTARPISSLINNPRNDVPACIAGPDDPPQPGEAP